MPEAHIPPAIHDNHHGHGHGHNQVGHEPIISRRWKWMTIVGNAVIGAAELATGNLQMMSVAGDGMHNVCDVVTYGMQANNVRDPLKSEEKRARARKAAYWMISAASLGVSAKAGLDLSLDQEGVPHAATVYAASASLTLNGLLLGRLYQGMQRRKRSVLPDVYKPTIYERDLVKHFVAVDVPSAALALGGAILHKYNVDVEQVAGVASGMLGAYAFRPTKKNLAQGCVCHGDI